MIGTSAPPTLTATTMDPDREQRDVDDAAEQAQQQNGEHVARTDADLAIRVGQDAHREHDDEEEEENQDAGEHQQQRERREHQRVGRFARKYAMS